MSAAQECQSILIVDDNPTNLEVLAETLTDSGFQISVALDGETALEQVKYHPPALILLDIMMPGIDGFETCRRLKSDPEIFDIPVIFLTALSDAENKVAGLSLGAVDYITKPFQREEVLARVSIHLKLYNLAKTLEAQNVILKKEVEYRKTVENLLQTFNQELEQQVEERTLKLTRTLQDLEKAQVQLVHSEKMSSLGQLVAGIAHEINNPVNFIYGNLSPASEYIQDLLKLAEFCQKYFLRLPDEFQEHLKQIDIEFLQDDLPRIIASMKVGADRIRQIVLSLRNFSRLDEAEVKPVDIHEGIESTLLILQSRLKGKLDQANIQVIKEYGDLPNVECYAGQLNQVFMNIINNAIDALEECPKFNRGHHPSNKELELKIQQAVQRTRHLNIAGQQDEPCIWIRTELASNGCLVVRIADNGSGIPESLRQRLFDPFFTTKPVGKGTGLGLSISHQIVVEKHGGNLYCESELGKGSEFRVEIPIQQ
ncbi:hybrid sensor histidine kinase/response regulator [Stenomitos frigidus]|uniref:histidine kinase n=1 Tax=Stenomitos frigidus ULC18 TaxID=2107698 RepID=A0A2T1DVD4_9CYAN|nr:response regulator [Stenomitos frigidus]PSB24447.1 hybrid sensor histidine kinase/response regulator [Stenomitos frigidus ULC18]